MSQPLSQYARLFLVDPEAFRASTAEPVLIWESPPEDVEKVKHTYEGLPWERPSASEPLVFSVAQSRARSRGLVLLGRSRDNDVRLLEESVSGEHAALRFEDKAKQWWLMDCNSTNGTRLAGKALAPRKWAKLPDRSVISVGHVDLKFLLPTSLADYLYVRSQ